MKFATTHEDIFDAIKTILSKHGFEVVDVPGVIYSYNETTKYVMEANFLNGYVGTGKKGVFYITLKSSDDEFCDAFIKTLQNNGIDNVYLLGDEDLSITLLYNCGSFRCLSIPMTPLASLCGSLTTTHNSIILPEAEDTDEDSDVQHSEEENEEYDELSEASDNEYEIPVSELRTLSSNYKGVLFQKHTHALEGETPRTSKKFKRV